MNAGALSLASLLLLAGAVAEAQLVHPVSDERSVSYHAALGPPCPLDTLYHSTPAAPFAPFNERSSGFFDHLGECPHGIAMLAWQNSAILSDSIRVYEFVESTIWGDFPLAARANSDARIRFSVEDGTRYHFDVDGSAWQSGGRAQLGIWLAGPEPSGAELQSLRVQLEPGTNPFNGGAQRRRGTLTAGIYTLEVHAWAEPTTFDVRGTIYAYLTLYAPTAVQVMTWDRVKALYRSTEGPSNHMLQPPAPRGRQR